MKIDDSVRVQPIDSFFDGFFFGSYWFGMLSAALCSEHFACTGLEQDKKPPRDDA